jgi:hypothetical protein
MSLIGRVAEKLRRIAGKSSISLDRVWLLVGLICQKSKRNYRLVIFTGQRGLINHFGTAAAKAAA